MPKVWLKYCIPLLMSVLYVSCSRVPSGILSEKDMQKVMTDIYLAEAMIGINNETYKSDTMKQALYESVFRKYNITQAEYDSSIVWYGRNMDIYMGVFNRMIDDLDKRADEMGDIPADPISGSSKKDSVDIWPRRSYFRFSANALFNGTTFDIRPSEQFPSGSIFVLGMNVWGLDKHMKNRPEIRITVEQGDTSVTVTDRINKDGYHQTILNSVATRRIKRIYGSIRLDNADMDYYKVYLDSMSLFRYNYGSQTPKAADKLPKQVVQ